MPVFRCSSDPRKYLSTCIHKHVRAHIYRQTYRQTDGGEKGKRERVRERDAQHKNAQRLGSRRRKQSMTWTIQFVYYNFGQRKSRKIPQVCTHSHCTPPPPHNSVVDLQALQAQSINAVVVPLVLYNKIPGKIGVSNTGFSAIGFTTVGQNGGNQCIMCMFCDI